MGGKKSGGSSHTPREAKETGRSYQIMRMLEVISEGEIYGLVDDMCSVYLDNTPLQNKDGTFNFQNVSVYANSGTQDQDVLKEFNSVEKEIELGTKILKNKPLIRTVTDTNVTRVRMTLGVERLMVSKDNGDIEPSLVTMRITVTKNNRAYSTRDYTFQGKYSSAYREMFYIDVPTAPFSIKVERVTDDSNSTKISNNTFWSSYTEIIDQAFAYPNTALVGMKIDSEYFSSEPTRNYEFYGLMVKVPANYDPFNHTYTSDIWNGEFKVEWTNNPAWIFYDLVTNNRYGMGQRLADFGIDKWQLYAIGRYCDELVPDGFGGKEPRMTCNIWITDQRKAYDLLNDLTSVFRAMPIWNGQALTAVQDRASDPVWTFNNANVIGGFTRQRSSMKARHNTIHVEYVDAQDSYEKKIESVSNDQMVARYGQNIKKVTAFGCTSRGQAYRTGRWILETERLETETISFTVGQEGLPILPYDVFEVADSEYAGLNIGGRIVSSNGTKVVLDREIEIDDGSYLSYVSNNAITENVKIVSYDNSNKTVTLAKSVGTLPEKTVWGLSTKRISKGLYRAISIKENDNGDSKTYTITGLQHVPEKENIVINGTHFDPKPQTIYGEAINAEIEYNGQTLSVKGVVNGNFNVLSSNTVSHYTVKLLKDGALVYIEKNLKAPEIKLDDLENGNYETVIYSYNDRNQLLKQHSKTFKIDRPPLVQNIEIYGHLSSIILTWDLVDDTTETEIWASEQDDISTARLVERIIGIYYNHSVGAKQVRYYWLRHKRGVNVGKFDQIQGRKGESSIDLDKELEVLQQELKKNIVDDVINVALPARKLGMTLYVENLTDFNTYLGQNTVYDETTNKQYTWNGTKYIPTEVELIASSLKGIIQPNQIATIPTTKLSGKLTDAQITQLNASKLTGNVNIARIPTIPKSKIDTTVIRDITQLQSANNAKTQEITNLTQTVGGHTSSIRDLGVTTGDLSQKYTQIKTRADNATSEISAIKQTQAGQATSIERLGARFDNLNVGGRNYLLNSKTLHNLWLGSSVVIDDGVAKFVGNGRLIVTYQPSSNIQNLDDGKVTISFTAKSNQDGRLHIRLRRFNTSNKFSDIHQYIAIDSREFKRYSLTLNYKKWENQDRVNFEIATYEQAGFVCEVKLPKLELGTIATDWTTAPEDVQTEIATKASSADLNTVRQTLANADNALSARIDTLQSDYNGNKSTVNNQLSTLSQADRTQAEQIRSMRSTLNDKANASALETLNTKVTQQGNLISSEARKLEQLKSEVNVQGTTLRGEVSTVSNSVISLKGEINSTHTIKAQAIAGGRTAIAGISIGTTANNRVAESSVIVLADKFQVAKNTNDNNPVSLFTIADNKAMIHGNLIVNGTISTDKIKGNSIETKHIKVNTLNADRLLANTIEGAKIKAAAIGTQHLQAGAISTDKLAVGLGGNLLQNPIFANEGYGWTIGSKSNSALVVTTEYRTADGFTAWYPNDALDSENVIFNRLTIGKGSPNLGYFDPFNRRVKVNPNQWYIFSVYANVYRMPTGSGRILVEEYTQENRFVRGIAESRVPLNRAYGSAQHNISGMGRYFVKFQAPASGVVSLRFRLQGTPSGSNPDVYVARPMLEECTEYASEPSAWVNAGVTSIHGGSIITNTITANQIKVLTLSALTSNLGSIDAGTIKGTTITSNSITGNNISGGTISATTITGTTIKGGTITGTSININNRFKVSSSGTVEMRSATNNVGMVMNNDSIVVYDTNGRVRVKIGKLK